jgi:hypothetical protein
MEKEMLSNIKAGISDIADRLDKKSKENGSKVREQFRQESETLSMAQFQSL